MINKTDLRIGNSVMYDNRIFQISAITDEFPLLNTPEFGIGVVDWNNIHPIPITEEALVKQLKFTKINEKLFCKGRLIVAIQDGRAFFTDDISVINLDGIHHLQNVFYFKHQTELSYE